MKPDAVEFFVVESGSFIQQCRMDRAQGGRQPSSAQGFGTATGGESNALPDFATVYSEIARLNVQALAVTGANTPIIPADEKQSAADSECPLLLGDASASNTEVVPPSLIIDPDVLLSQTGACAVPQQSADEDSAHDPVAAQASAIISQSLMALTAALHIDTDPELQQLSIAGKSDEAVEQLSDILATLKKLAGVFDAAVAQDQQLDIGNKTYDVPTSQKLATLIHAQVFRIEIAASMLGIAERLNGALAEKLQVPFGGNIPQAMEPSQLSMPQSHLQQLLGQAVPDPSVTISVLAQKIRELCARQGESAPVPANGTAVEQKKSESVSGVFQFDTQTMRKLLKIDGNGHAGNPDADTAGQNGKQDLPEGMLKVAVKNAPDAVLKLAEELQSVAGGAAKNLDGTPLLSVPEGKSSVATSRMLDESVMTQIAEKLHTAVRSGITEIRIQLRPESLGEVKLRIRVDGDVVFARIQVESQQIKQIVETNLQSLKDALSFQHLQAGSLEVSVGSDGGERKADGQLTDASSADGRDTFGNEEGNNRAGTEPSLLPFGSDTGRRFGENTVEYFA
jgi:flagellar hook-length control protein FliK